MNARDKLNKLMSRMRRERQTFVAGGLFAVNAPGWQAFASQEGISSVDFIWARITGPADVGKYDVLGYSQGDLYEWVQTERNPLIPTQSVDAEGPLIGTIADGTAAINLQGRCGIAPGTPIRIIVTTIDGITCYFFSYSGLTTSPSPLAYDEALAGDGANVTYMIDNVDLFTPEGVPAAPSPYDPWSLPKALKLNITLIKDPANPLWVFDPLTNTWKESTTDFHPAWLSAGTIYAYWSAPYPDTYFDYSANSSSAFPRIYGQIGNDVQFLVPGFVPTYDPNFRNLTPPDIIAANDNFSVFPCGWLAQTSQSGRIFIEASLNRWGLGGWTAWAYEFMTGQTGSQSINTFSFQASCQLDILGGEITYVPINMNNVNVPSCANWKIQIDIEPYEP